MLNKLLFLISLWSAKLISRLISFLHIGQASNFPGKVALSINKDFLKYFKFNEEVKTVLITGTNGKSTTCGLLYNILKSAGHEVINNKAGANLLSGISSTFSFHSDLFGNIKEKFLVLEIDEATLPLVTEFINADIIAVTNLFRDQLDRFGELDTTAKLIEKGINNCKNPLIILNADDSRVAFLKTNNKKIYYGINKERTGESVIGRTGEKDWSTEPQETTVCPECKSELIFTSKFLAHLGNYKCKKCNFKKPAPDFTVTNFKTDDLTINFDVSSNCFSQNKNNFFLPMIGLFNLYNALCCIAIAKTISNITSVQIQKGFQSYSTIFGRGEKILIKGKTAWLFLIKNPTGTTEILKTLITVPNARFLIAINDNFADGRDVSWLWDAKFDILSNHKKDIYVTGKRAEDMALRLKYANIDQSKIQIQENIMSGINKSLKSLNQDELLYILPTYTALLELQKKGICKAAPLN